jgi:hypothetical protein
MPIVATLLVADCCVRLLETGDLCNAPSFTGPSYRGRTGLPEYGGMNVPSILGVGRSWQRS